MSLFDADAIHPMLAQANRLTPAQLRSLADGYDQARSARLSAPVLGEIKTYWEWAIFPAPVFALCDAILAAAAAAGMNKTEAHRAWQAAADEVTARLFLQLPEADRSELGSVWRRAVGTQQEKDIARS